MRRKNKCIFFTIKIKNKFLNNFLKIPEELFIKLIIKPFCIYTCYQFRYGELFNFFFVHAASAAHSVVLFLFPRNPAQLYKTNCIFHHAGYRVVGLISTSHIFLHKLFLWLINYR